MSTTLARRRALFAVLGTIALALTALLALARPADAAGSATVTVNTTGALHDGETISVSGNAGAPNAPDLYVAVCEGAPTASNCDQSLAGLGSATAHILIVSPDPTTGAWGPVNFYVRGTIVTGHTPAGYDCTTAGTCVIGTTNSLNPADHSYDATSLLDFGTTTPTTTAPPPPPATSSSTGGSGTPTLKLSTTKLTSGQKVTVTGSHFPATPTTMYLSVCKNPPTATDCDVTIGDFAVVNYDGSGSFTTQLTLHTSFKSGDGAVDCAKTACVIGTTNGMNPADHSYNAVLAFQIDAASTVKTSATTASGAKSSASSTNAPGSGALAETGPGDQAAIIGVAVTLLAAGATLALLGASRRRQH